MAILYIIDLLGVAWVVFDTIYQILKTSEGTDEIKPWERMYSRKSCIFWCCLKKGILRDYDKEEKCQPCETEQGEANGG